MGLRVPDAIPVLTDPTLGFRLDPGEPGVLRGAPASRSTLRVAEQEGRNVRRLEAQARREGRVVTRAVTTFTRAPAGSFLGTVAGLTTVESVEPRPTATDTAANLAEARTVPGAQTDAPDANLAAGGGLATGPGPLGLFNDGFRFSDGESVQRERQLLASQAALERRLLRAAGAPVAADDPQAAQDAREQVARLRRAAQAVEREINRLRLAQLAEQQATLTATLLGAGDAQARAIGDVVQAANSAPTPPGAVDLVV